MGRRKQQAPDSDRERILCNIASQLAYELNSLHNYLRRRRIDVPDRYIHVEIVNERDVQKGDLVSCWTSTTRQQNPFLVSFVEGPADNGDGLLLRAIGTDRLSNYGNEQFIRITGIPERLLWEGDKRAFAIKVNKAFRKLDNMWHCFRGLRFDPDNQQLAYIFVGERFGGGEKPTKPYRIDITYTKRTTIKSIIQQMKEQGYGTRQFEPDDDKYTGPREGYASFTRDDLISQLKNAGIELKPTT